MFVKLSLTVPMTSLLYDAVAINRTDVVDLLIGARCTGVRSNLGAHMRR